MPAFDGSRRPPLIVRGATYLLLLAVGMASGELFLYLLGWVVDRLLPRPARVTGPVVLCAMAFIALVAWSALKWFAQDPASDLRLQAAIACCVFLPPAGLAWLLMDNRP